MKLFKHYKNKYYKYLGIAKHSETLEELVLYECHYDNPAGKIWVRPRDLFFGTHTIDAKSAPRFREIPVEIKTYSEVSPKEISIIAPIIASAFGKWDPIWFEEKFREHTKYLLIIAYIEAAAVGFKIGYEEDPSSFYSWLGGVLPEWRGLGIASTLMRAQHSWCQNEGYKKVRTKTQNKYREMLLLNVKFGFDVISVYESSESGPKIVMEKLL